MARLIKLRRMLRVGSVLARHGVALAWARLRRGRALLDGPARLRQLLEDLGGSYIKLGQVLSLQPDALPVAYCDALFDLLDKVPPFHYGEVERTFVEDLGRGPREIFQRFEPLPIASASIGQVHVAYLNGRKLAVKVRRPTVELDFAADVLVLRLAASTVETLRLSRWRWLVQMLREFCAWTHEELDYRYEARFMAALARNARDNPRSAVPEVLSDYSTPRILVADFLEGPMVLDYIRSLRQPDPALRRRLAEQGFDGERVARNIVRNFVSDAFHHGLFHADLHPGNLLILADNVVGYVDFGITGSLSVHSRRTMVSLTLALTRADLDAMMTYFLRIAVVERSSDVEGFRRALDGLLDKWFDRGGTHPRLRVSFSVIMVDMLRLSRLTGLWPTPDVIRYLRSVITADGLVKRFAPGLRVNDYLERVCLEYLQENVWRHWGSTEHMADLAGELMLCLQPAPADVDRGLSESEAEPQWEARPPAVSSAWRRLALGGLAFGSALLAQVCPPQWGLNLFTAAVAVGAAAAGALLWRLRGT